MQSCFAKANYLDVSHLLSKVDRKMSLFFFEVEISVTKFGKSPLAHLNIYDFIAQDAT